MKLHHQTYFEHQPLTGSKVTPVVIIPGLFGAVGNWRSFAKRLSQHAPVIVIDQRNHGQSPHSPDNSYADCVDDVLELLDDFNLERASLCGHSMGGKTAMTFALTYPERLDKLLVLDIAPVAYSHSHASVLEALKRVDLTAMTSRAEVEKQLATSIEDKSVRLFIMLSLSSKNGGFFWRINIDGLYQNLTLISGFPHQTLSHKNYSKSCLFIKGEQSDYVHRRHYEIIGRLFPAASIETISEAGHWLHIEQPDAVLNKVVKFLTKE